VASEEARLGRPSLNVHDEDLGVSGWDDLHRRTIGQSPCAAIAEPGQFVGLNERVGRDAGVPQIRSGCAPRGTEKLRAELVTQLVPAVSFEERGAARAEEVRRVEERVFDACA
jgi:hypothetical protein